MLRVLFAALIALSVATPAAAENRYYAYDPADRLTRSLTGGLTFEVERGLFGGQRIVRLYTTAAGGSTPLQVGGPDAVRRSLPEGAEENAVYAIPVEGDGRGLIRALCPGADEAWLVFGRLRPARPLTAHAVGRWIDGTFRSCASLNWSFRGEWSRLPPGTASGSDVTAVPTRQ